MPLSERLDYWQTASERWREIIFSPFLKFCRYGGITANNIATLRLLLAVAFPFLITEYHKTAWWLMGISIFLDAFDGALARFEKIASDRGKFIDVLVDQITFGFLGIGLIRLLPDMSFALGLLTFLIPLLYLLASVAGNEGRPSDWLIKPQARLTIYKIIFLVIIIGYYTDGWPMATTRTLLLLEAIVVGVHSLWHYFRFISGKNIWRT